MIHFSNISKSAGNKVLFKNASFQINSNEKVGLVGANGSGKSTLFKMIVGETKPDSGEVVFSNKLVIGYFSQDIEDMGDASALEYVKAINTRIVEVQERLQKLELKLSEPLDDESMQAVLTEYGDLQTEFEQSGGYDLEHRASENLSGLGFKEAELAQSVSSFSGGWRMRIKLAKLLTLSPDLLIMDEPTNHLDLESIQWLELWLKEFKGAVFMTSHDRSFLNSIVTKIVEVAHQAIHLYSGDYNFYEVEKDIRLEQLLASAKRQEDMLAKERDFIARFAARASHAAQVQSRVKKLEKIEIIEIIEIPADEQTINFQWPECPRGGDQVLTIEGLGKTWPAQNGGLEKRVFDKVDALVRRQDRVAIVGVNGAGKSTFLKVITGQTPPSSGRFDLGPSIEYGYFSQNSLEQLDPHATILEEVQSRLPTLANGVVRNLLGAFLFSGDDVDKKISVLSGGEKSRIMLACLLIKPLNLLVLDEPTNHLDIQSRGVLLRALKSFGGTLMIVSHDRFFLKELCNKVFLIDQEKLHSIEGSWDYFLKKRSQYEK